MQRSMMFFLRCLAVCMMLITVSPAASAENPGAAVPDYDSRIDAAFQAGEITWTEKEVPKPDPETCTILTVPQERCSEDWTFPDETQLRDALRTEELSVLAFSPDGKTALGCVREPVSNIYIPLAVTGDQVRIIYPSHARGAEDPSRALDDYYRRYYYTKRANTLGIDYHGLIWSPDGRYYYAPNEKQTFTMWKPHFFIVDAWTGEMIALDSISSKPGNSYGGSLLSGTFSADGQYFYGMYYGPKYEADGRCKLIRYDLNSFEAVVLSSSDPLVTSVITLRDGELFGLEDVLSRDSNRQYMDRIAPDGTVRPLPMPLTKQYWFSDHIEYSSRSGWAVLRGGETYFFLDHIGEPISGLGIMPVRPDDDSSDDMDSAYFVDNETKELVFAPVMSRILDENGNVRLYNGGLFRIMDYELSPDGRYLAMLVYRPENSRFNTDAELELLIVRLEDHAYLAAKGIDIFEDPKTSNGKKGWALYRYTDEPGNQVLNWTDAGLLTNCSKTQLWEIAP